MVDYSKKFKIAGIILAAVLLIGAAVALAMAWGPGSDKEEIVENGQAVLLDASSGTVEKKQIAVLDDFLIDADKPVFLDFWAEWCGPCKLSEPFVETLSEEYDGKAYIVKINIDEQPEIASAFRIQSIPTFAVVNDGSVVDAAMGYADSLQDDLRGMIDAQLN